MDNINEQYVEWANTLDAAGLDSTEARERLSRVSMLELIYTVGKLVEDTDKIADQLKKYIFYGKQPEGGSFGRRIIGLPHQMVNARDAFVDDLMLSHVNIKHLHALLGLITEVAELSSTFMGHIFDASPIDHQNMTEEIGDIFWYLALFAKSQGYTDFEPYLFANRAKLVARYGDTWSQERALNRDTANEMAEHDKALQVLKDESPCFCYHERFNPECPKHNQPRQSTCLLCGHKAHEPNGCFNAESDSDCNCHY